MRRVAASIAVLASLSAAQAAPSGSVVLLAEDGGLGRVRVQTVRTIASNEPRARGIVVTDDPGFHETLPPTDEVLQTVSGLGVDRLFVRRLGPLGEKVMFSMEELRSPERTGLFVATLTGESIQEADTVVPRLVRAVLERVPAEETASIATVTAQESRAFRKKPGEGLWMVGLGGVPLGRSLGWSHEAENWRLGALIQGPPRTRPSPDWRGPGVPWRGTSPPISGPGSGSWDLGPMSKLMPRWAASWIWGFD